MSLAKEAWDTLRSVATVLEKLTELSAEVKALRAEHRDLRDRVVRIETIIDEARRHAADRRSLPAKS
jgi:predicted  nucleic acid-binding Zn-ribbon protein